MTARAKNSSRCTDKLLGLEHVSGPLVRLYVDVVSDAKRFGDIGQTLLGASEPRNHV